MSLPIPGAPKSSPGDRPLFKGLSTDPYLRAFFKGLEGSENFFNSFLTPTEPVAFERMSGQVSICSRSLKRKLTIYGNSGGYIYIALYIYQLQNRKGCKADPPPEVTGDGKFYF